MKKQSIRVKQRRTENDPTVFMPVPDSLLELVAFKTVFPARGRLDLDVAPNRWSYIDLDGLLRFIDSIANP